MKQLWIDIKETVENSYLTKEGKKNVIEALDSVIGKYILESRFPLSKSNLDEDEWIVYREIISSLNEGRDFPKVKNDSQYVKVVKDIFKAVNNKPSKRLAKKLIEMDDAYNNSDWTEVNRSLSVISQMV